MNSVLYSYRCPTRHLQNALLLSLLLAMAVLAGSLLYHAPPWATGLLLPGLFALSALAAAAQLAAWSRATRDSLVVTETHIRWQTGLLVRRRGTIRLAEVRAVYADLHRWDSGRPDRLAFATVDDEVIRIPGDCLRSSARPIINLLREAHPHLAFIVDEKP